MYAYTWCDSTNAFKGIGKIKPLKLLKKCPEFEETFSKLGEEWEVSNEVINDLERFTCRLFGCKETQLNEARAYLLKLKWQVES